MLARLPELEEWSLLRLEVSVGLPAAARVPLTMWAPTGGGGREGGDISLHASLGGGSLLLVLHLDEVT